jgi:hypothetical protein
MKRPAQSFLLITLILVALPCGVWAVETTHSSESPIWNYSKSWSIYSLKRNTKVEMNNEYSE